LVNYVLLMLIIDHYNHNKKKKYGPIEDIKKSIPLAQLYLDQFYITNKIYTFSMTFLYLLSMVFIFIWIRYLTLDNLVLITSQDNIYSSLISIIFGCLYQLTYRIATLTYKENMYPMDPDIEYLFNSEYDYVIDNKRVIAWAYKAMDLTRRSILIQKLFRLLAYIFGYIFKHIHNLNQPFPYFILITIFVIDLYNKEFHNIYLVSFIYLIVKTKRDLVTFINNRNGSSDYTLNLYFYSKDKLDIIKSIASRHNWNLIRELNNIIEYTYNKDFVETLEHLEGPGYKQEKRRETGMYKRVWVIIGFIGISYYLLFQNNIVSNIPIIVLLFPIIIMR
jgi:hypothetical protein